MHDATAPTLALPNRGVTVPLSINGSGHCSEPRLTQGLGFTHNHMDSHYYRGPNVGNPGRPARSQPAATSKLGDKYATDWQAQFWDDVFHP